MAEQEKLAAPAEECVDRFKEQHPEMEPDDADVPAPEPQVPYAEEEQV